MAERSGQIRVDGVGELIDEGQYWRLIYAHCDHIQLFAREGLDDLEDAAVYVRRYFIECLTCRHLRDYGQPARPRRSAEA